MRTIKFDGKDSWDWYELLTLSISTEEPEMKESKVDIAGRDGDLDMSEAIAGYPVYYNRKLMFKFRAIGDECQKLRGEFVKDVHGKKHLIEVEDEDHMYDGRCKVTIIENRGYYLDLRVDVDAYPYKTDNKEKSYTKTIGGADFIDILNNGDSHAVPTIKTKSRFAVTFAGETTEYPAGTHTALFSIPPGQQRVYFEGEGTVTISFMEGYLV